MKTPEIANNPAWTSYLDTVREVDKAGSDLLMAFIAEFPTHLRSTVAVALSLAKWHILHTEGLYTLCASGSLNCACCIYYEGRCHNCPLGPGANACLIIDFDQVEPSLDTLATCNRITSVYTRMFKALNYQDKQEIPTGRASRIITIPTRKKPPPPKHSAKRKRLVCQLCGMAFWSTNHSQLYCGLCSKHFHKEG